ncbi:5-formyltetrahydrofolate cyclo-ligase [Larkinella humicola]|uniref:5-formyltetrahydrofolate cyclo-ligase n=1 Tax=Larkinella humicola TaxID=2607654 RepID=A0A5N1JLQ1_9BACT|nr:5-formyltetrahydrofolate cyclo-ligase [Larkinella humicola]KAA9353904.1 5-formyltetrahydrofolate cyclo-ligase [Larkinella humicola]
MTKSELRAALRQKRRSLSETEWQNRCEAISNQFFTLLPSKPVSVIGTFLPIESQKEVNTWLIVRRLWRDFPQIRVAAPVTNLETGTLENYEITPQTEFIKNRYGIPEPLATSSFIIHHSSFNIILIPLLTFDQTGNRVGYGGGFYDRFLAQCRPDCLKIGLSLFDPVDQIDDVYEGDIRINFCITPDQIWDF